MNLNYPFVRPRRLRNSPQLLKLVQETKLDPSKFIMPYFVSHGKGIKEPIGTMPGQFRYSIDELLKELQKVEDLKIGGILLFVLFMRNILSIASSSFMPVILAISKKGCLAIGKSD